MHGKSGGMCGKRGPCVVRGHAWQRACAWHGGMYGGGWAVWQGGLHGRGRCAWQGRQPLQLTVCILLECILVVQVGNA